VALVRLQHTYSFCASITNKQESLVEAVEAGIPTMSRKDGGAICKAKNDNWVEKQIQEREIQFSTSEYLE